MNVFLYDYDYMTHVCESVGARDPVDAARGRWFIIGGLLSSAT